MSKLIYDKARSNKAVALKQGHVVSSAHAAMPVTDDVLVLLI